MEGEKEEAICVDFPMTQEFVRHSSWMEQMVQNGQVYKTEALSWDYSVILAPELKKRLHKAIHPKSTYKSSVNITFQFYILYSTLNWTK